MSDWWGLTHLAPCVCRVQIPLTIRPPFPERSMQSNGLKRDHFDLVSPIGGPSRMLLSFPVQAGSSLVQFRALALRLRQYTLLFSLGSTLLKFVSFGFETLFWIEDIFWSNVMLQ